MLLFGLHCHQPVDNFGWVIDEAVKKCYRPLFSTLEKYPEFKFSLHVSGWLLEFFRKKYVDLFLKLKNMSKRGQVEFFSGGFYEPILEAIPEEDRIYQIRRMNNYIKNHFHQTPKGLWLTERVYSDKIVKSVVESGIQYMVIDDTFVDKFSYTSVDGYTVRLLPISKLLRYAIPFKEADSVEILLKSNDVNIIFDDCEKFGLWPGTYEWVYTNRWLEKFLSKDLKTILPRDFIKTNTPIKVSLPDHSYPEMEEWSLDNEDYFEFEEVKNKLIGLDERKLHRFLRGGVWSNFLNKYFEANWIQKRLWYLSKNKIDKRNYVESLSKGQCNDVLWHGIFGGLYLPNLRDNAYRYIIACENMLDKRGMERLDLDLDFKDEYIYRMEDYVAVFNSEGELIEFDDKKNLFNFQNTLKRYKERYHFSKEDRKVFDTIHHLSFDFSKYPIRFDERHRFSFMVEPDSYTVKPMQERITFVGKRVRKDFRFLHNCIRFSIFGATAFQMNLHFANNYNYIVENKQFSISDEYTKRTLTLDFSDEFEFNSEDIITYSLKEGGVDSIKQCVAFNFAFKHNNIKGRLCLR